MASHRARKRALDAAYRIARQQRYVQARARCEMCGKGLGDGWQSHHVQRRLNSGIADHAVDNLRVLDRDCHAWLHANVKEAKEQGWIVAKWPQL